MSLIKVLYLYITQMQAAKTLSEGRKSTHLMT